MESTSKRFQLNSIDWAKIGKGLLIVLAGSALTYLTELIGKINLGEWTPLVVTGWSLLVNIIRKWLTDHTPESSNIQ